MGSDGDTIFLATDAGMVEMHAELFDAEDVLQGLLEHHPDLWPARR